MSKRTSPQLPDYTDSFEKIVQNFVETRTKKKKLPKKTSQDEINFKTTFKPIDKKKYN